MKEFEKSLEESCNKINNSMSGDLEYGFQKGARWAREFTIEEIMGYMKINGYFNLADAIQYNFKDRGGE